MKNAITSPWAPATAEGHREREAEHRHERARDEGQPEDWRPDALTSSAIVLNKIRVPQRPPPVGLKAHGTGRCSWPVSPWKDRIAIRIIRDVEEEQEQQEVRAESPFRPVEALFHLADDDVLRAGDVLGVVAIVSITGRPQVGDRADHPDADHQHDDEQHRRGGPLRILDGSDLGVDRRADRGDVAANGGYGIVAHRQDEDEDRSDHDAEIRLRPEDHLSGTSPPVDAEVARRFRRRPVDLRQREEQRIDHEEDVELDHREPHGEGREPELRDRLGDDRAA